MSEKEAEDSDESALIRMEGYERWISQCFNYICRSLIGTLQRKLRSPYSMYSYSPSPNENVSRLEKQGRSISTLLYSTLLYSTLLYHRIPPTHTINHHSATAYQHSIHFTYPTTKPAPPPAPAPCRTDLPISSPLLPCT